MIKKLTTLLCLLIGLMTFSLFAYCAKQLFFPSNHWQAFQAKTTDPVINQPLGDHSHYIHFKPNHKPHHVLNISFSANSQAKYLALRLGNRLEQPKNQQALIQVLTQHGLITLGHLHFDHQRAPTFTAFSPLTFYRLPQLSGSSLRLVIQTPPGQAAQGLSLLTLGFSDQPIALSPLSQWLIQHHQTILYVLMIGLLLCHSLKKYRPPLLLSALSLASLALAGLSLNLFATWNSVDFISLRAFTAANPLASMMGANLNYGLYLGNNVFNGQGLLYSGQAIDWARMPGYPLLIALAGFINLVPGNLVTLALSTMMFEIILIACALGFCFYGLQKIMQPLVALIVALLLLNLRGQIPYIQVESVMPAITFFILGAGACYLSASDRLKKLPPLGYHILLHAAFALWLLMRPDVMVGWLVVSLILYLPKMKYWPYLLIPVLFFASITLPWALYKQPHTHEFSLTTDTVGEVFVNGLFVSQPHPFVLDGGDGAFFDWARQQWPDKSPQSHAVSKLALKEALRFYATYPIYTLSIVWHNFTNFICGWATPGIDNGFRPGKIVLLLLLTLAALSLVVGYRRDRLVLLGWPIYLNLPIYFFTFNSGGRFYFPAISAILTTGIPLLFEKSFYQRVYKTKNPLKYAILALAALIYIWGPSVDNHLRDNKTWRYWAPFMDPKNSKLSTMKPTS
jgi:hypothetical protein